MEEKYKINPKLKNAIEWIYCVLIAVVLALLVRHYIGTPTVVKQPSMYPTLQEGQRLLLNRWARTVGSEYKRGEVITFEAPSQIYFRPFEVNIDNPVGIYTDGPKNVFAKISYYVFEFNKVSYIKRVIGVAGEHVKIEDGKVYINGAELYEPYLVDNVTTDGGTFRDIVVPEGYVFVMGDNRMHSTDSRTFGCIPIEKIESKVWGRFWPLRPMENLRQMKNGILRRVGAHDCALNKSRRNKNV